MLLGLIHAAGGLGVFLLGMSIMTDGLKTLADDRLRTILARSTRNPISAVLTGAVATAIVQSSSATTVAAVGLVHAGLLTFSESLGIIYGANIGTTITGWMVALLGFKLKLGEIVMPLVLAGALIRLLTSGRMKAVGTALSGFGLVFIGIALLQDGMGAFEGAVTPASFPPDTISGRVWLVLIGVVITLITQSSSAGVATALVAVHTGTISLNQAAAMVIGMDLGTTATAAIATVGGNVQARRTGFAHVFYNALTAVMALILLTPYFALLNQCFPKISSTSPEIALVSFHTFFNGLGVLAILPLNKLFARLIEWTFPEREHPLVRRLDPSLLQSPEAAIGAAVATIESLTQSLLNLLLPSLKDASHAVDLGSFQEISEATDKTRTYLERIRIAPHRELLRDRYARAVHVLDHLNRILDRANDQPRLARTRDDDSLSEMTDILISSVELLATESPISAETESLVRKRNQELKTAMRRYRVNILQQTAAGNIETRVALQRMDTARAVRRIGYHIWRIADHAADSPIDRDVTCHVPEPTG